jgi:hypothetical protein
MRYGVARDLITPPFKMNMGGYDSRYGEGFKGVHDDLCVKSLLLDDGRRRLLFVTHDLINVTRDHAEELTDYAMRRHGIPPGHVVVSATHTHAGPTCERMPGQWETADYQEFLRDRARRCIDRACTTTHEGEMAFGVVEGDWNMNRRALVSGVIQNAPNPAGPVDRALNFIRVAGRDGGPCALLLNYACHPVTLGDTWWLSAEFPGRLCQLIEAGRYGTTALFFQGAGANARPRIAAASPTSWKNCSFDEVDRMASSMASAVHSALREDRLRRLQPELAAVAFHVDLPLNVRGKEQVREALVQESHAGQRIRLQDLLDRYDLTGDIHRLRAGIVRLDDDVYVAWMSGETCVEVKQVVEKVFAGKALIFIGYCDSSAYVPTDRLLDEGGYESSGSVFGFRMKGPFRKGIDAQLSAAFEQALERLCACTL